MAKQHWALLGSGAGVGAGLMYLLDPAGGRRRRAFARDKAVSAVSTGGDSLRKVSTDLGNRTKDLYAAVGSRLRKDEVSDRRLKALVRSTLEQELSYPSAVVVDVVDGQCTLGGAVLASELAELLAAVEAVKGVQGILNHLEVHESAENIPGLQKKSGLLKGRNLAPTARLLAGTAGGALALAGLKRRDKIGAALGGVGLSLLATSGIAKLRGRKKNGLEDLPQPLRDEEQVPVQGTEEGTFQPETI